MVHDCKCSFIDHSRRLIYAKRLDIIKSFEENLVFIAGGEGEKGEFQWGNRQGISRRLKTIKDGLLKINC